MTSQLLRRSKRLQHSPSPPALPPDQEDHDIDIHSETFNSAKHKATDEPDDHNPKRRKGQRREIDMDDMKRNMTSNTVVSPSRESSSNASSSTIATDETPIRAASLIEDAVSESGEDSTLRETLSSIESQDALIDNCVEKTAGLKHAIEEALEGDSTHPRHKKAKTAHKEEEEEGASNEATDEWLEVNVDITSDKNPGTDTGDLNTFDGYSLGASGVSVCSGGNPTDIEDRDHPAQDDPKEVIREVCKESFKEITKEITKGNTKVIEKVSKEVRKEVTTEITNGGTKRVVMEVTQEVSKGDTNEIIKEVTKEIFNEGSQEVIKETSREITKGDSNEIIKEVTKETSKGGEVTKETSREVTKGTKDGLHNEAHRNDNPANVVQEDSEELDEISSKDYLDGKSHTANDYGSYSQHEQGGDPGYDSDEDGLDFAEYGSPPDATGWITPVRETTPTASPSAKLHSPPAIHRGYTAEVVAGRHPISQSGTGWANSHYNRSAGSDNDSDKENRPPSDDEDQFSDEVSVIEVGPSSAFPYGDRRVTRERTESSIEYVGGYANENVDEYSDGYDDDYPYRRPEAIEDEIGDGDWVAADDPYMGSAYLRERNITREQFFDPANPFMASPGPRADRAARVYESSRNIAYYCRSTRFPGTIEDLDDPEDRPLFVHGRKVLFDTSPTPEEKANDKVLADYLKDLPRRLKDGSEFELRTVRNGNSTIVAERGENSDRSIAGLSTHPLSESADIKIFGATRPGESETDEEDDSQHVPPPTDTTLEAERKASSEASGGAVVLFGPQANVNMPSFEFSLPL